MGENSVLRPIAWVDFRKLSQTLPSATTPWLIAFVEVANLDGESRWYDSNLLRTLIFTKKLPELLNEKAFPSFAGLLDFSATGSLPNPREVPYVQIIRQCCIVGHLIVHRSGSEAFRF
jgi:hypothetical protein